MLLIFTSVVVLFEVSGIGSTSTSSITSTFPSTSGSSGTLTSTASTLGGSTATQSSRGTSATMFSLSYSTTISASSTTPADGSLRFAGNGSTQYQGRVEIFHNGQWGTVCDDKFDANEAVVVCRQLGISPEGAIVGSPTDRFGPGTGVIWLDELNCVGNEMRLTDCQFNNWNTDCAHSEDIGVECRAERPLTTQPPGGVTSPPIVSGRGNCSGGILDVRLVGPQNLPSSGVVQVKKAGQNWTTVCDDNFDRVDAQVVCGQLCYDPDLSLAATSNTFSLSGITEPVESETYDCVGNETSLLDCPTSLGDCGPDEMAVVSCQPCVDTCDYTSSRLGPELECTNGSMIAKFSTVQDPAVDTSYLNVANAGTGTCNAPKARNGTYVTISIPYNECGTSKQVNATHIIYNNAINYGPTYAASSIISTNSYIIHLACEIPRNAIVHKPFVPDPDVLNITASGQFRANIKFFSDKTFTTPVAQFPLRVNIGRVINASVELEEPDPDLKLVVPNCFATPTSNRNHAVNWPLFTDKCIIDPSVSMYSLDNKRFAYCVQAFKFSSYAEVHVHCDAYVCLRHSVAPECDRSCFSVPASGRKKRSTSKPQMYQISSKLVVVYDSVEEENVVKVVKTATEVTPPESSQAVENSQSTTTSFDHTVLDVNLTPSPKSVTSPKSSQAVESSRSTTSYEQTFDVNLTPSPKAANLNENELEKENEVSISDVADIEELNINDETSGSTRIFMVSLPLTFFTLAQWLVYFM